MFSRSFFWQQRCWCVRRHDSLSFVLAARYSRSSRLMRFRTRSPIRPPRSSRCRGRRACRASQQPAAAEISAAPLAAATAATTSGRWRRAARRSSARGQPAHGSGGARESRPLLRRPQLQSAPESRSRQRRPPAITSQVGGRDRGDTRSPAGGCNERSSAWRQRRPRAVRATRAPRLRLRSGNRRSGGLQENGGRNIYVAPPATTITTIRAGTIRTDMARSASVISTTTRTRGIRPAITAMKRLRRGSTADIQAGISPSESGCRGHRDPDVYVDGYYAGRVGRL